MKKNVIVAHKDADGMMSAAIISTHFNALNFEVMLTKGGGDNTTDAIVSRKPDLTVLLDYRPSVSAMRKILENSTRVLWFDHHAGREEIEDKLQVAGIRSDETPATCALVWSWCYDIKEVERMPRAVRLIHYNDIGDFNKPDVRAFKSYIHHTMPSVDEYIRMLRTDVDMEIGIGKRLVDTARTRDGSMLAKTSFYAKYKKLKLLCINGFVTKDMFDLCRDTTVDAFVGFQQVKPDRTNIVLIRPPWKENDMRTLIDRPEFVGVCGKCAAVVRTVSFSAKGEMRLHW